MGRVRRARLSGRERAALWKRWKRGESPTDIGRALARDWMTSRYGLNTRPRKTLGYETPADRLVAAVASTG